MYSNLNSASHKIQNSIKYYRWFYIIGRTHFAHYDGVSSYKATVIFSVLQSSNLVVFISHAH